jgi:hypothetical protein
MSTLTFTVNGVAFSSADSISNGESTCVTEGRYYSSDAASGLGSPPLVGSQEFDDREVVFVGVDDVGIKRFGRRTRTISASLLYASYSKGAVEAMLEEDFGADGNLVGLARYTITTPGNTSYEGCRLIIGGAETVTWGPPLGDAFVAQIKAVWKQYSQAN